jgi:fibrillarin-like rRNA methylase
LKVNAQTDKLYLPCIFLKKDSNAEYVRSSFKSLGKQMIKNAKSWRSNSEIRSLIANTYIKTLILLLIREMKIILYLGIPPGSFQYSERINVARRK